MNQTLQQHADPSRRMSFYLEDVFYDGAEVLRSQFEDQLSTRCAQNVGITPFMYASCENAYQFLTASADRIFTPDILADLIAKVRDWAARAVGTCHVSTPQARVYILGCSRSLLRDDVAAPWHYVLSLTRASHAKHVAQVKVLSESPVERASAEVRVEQLVCSQLTFNQLLVHRASDRYSVEPTRTSTNPVDGAVFLDGYLW
jgi:hypothetical protein